MNAIPVQTFLWLMGWMAAGFVLFGFASFAFSVEDDQPAGAVGGVALSVFGLLVIIACILLGQVK